MTTDQALCEAIQVIEDEALQLKAWADSSVRGGWSTHQVDPMRTRADVLAMKAIELRAVATHAGHVAEFGLRI